MSTPSPLIVLTLIDISILYRVPATRLTLCDNVSYVPGVCVAPPPPAHPASAVHPDKSVAKSLLVNVSLPSDGVSLVESKIPPPPPPPPGINELSNLPVA